MTTLYYLTLNDSLGSVQAKKVQDALGNTYYLTEFGEAILKQKVDIIFNAEGRDGKYFTKLKLLLPYIAHRCSVYNCAIARLDTATADILKECK